MEIDADRDREIGRETFLHLNRFTQRLGRRHGLSAERASDFVLAGALFTTAQLHNMSLDEVVEWVEVLAQSLQQNHLPDATRH